jgi:hypothetical protein
MAEHSPSRMFDLADEEVVAYRGLSSLAVAGLLAGLLSPLAYLDSTLWLLPLAAASASGLALWRIAVQSPNLVGRKAALAGLLLGMTFLVAAPTSTAVYRYLIRREALQFAAGWIDAVRNGDVLAAHQLMLDPRKRAPPDVPLVPFYSQSDYHMKMLDMFKAQAVVRTLFALGRSATYRFYETDAEGSQEDGDYVKSTYAVTFADEQNQKKTFFITLGMSRKVDANSGRCDWTTGRVEGPVTPVDW